MSYFTEFRDQLTKSLGISSGEDAAKTLGDATRKGSQIIQGSDRVVTKVDNQNNPANKDVRIEGSEFAGFKLPNLGYVAGIPVALILGAGALYLLLKRK